MSANPETFDRLRAFAYGWVTKHGRDDVGLHGALTAEVATLRRQLGYDLTEGDATAIVDAVATWTIKNFRPRTARLPRRTRFTRALEAGLLMEMANDLKDTKPAGRKRAGSVRSLARATGMSKSKVDRILSADRKRKVAKAILSSLSPTAKGILEILDATLLPDGHGFVQLSDLSTVFWGSGPVSRTTPAMRQRRLAHALKEIDAADIGFQVLQIEKHSSFVAIAKGRRWRTMSDLDVDLKSILVSRKFTTIPSVIIRSRLGLLWGSREGREVIAAYRIAMDMMEWEDFQILFEACHFTFEPVPALHILDHVYRKHSGSVEMLPNKMDDAVNWRHVSKESARAIKKYSSLLKDLGALGRADKAAFVVERSAEVSNWRLRLQEWVEPSAIGRFEKLRKMCLGFQSFDDFLVELEQAGTQHRRGRRPILRA